MPNKIADKDFSISAIQKVSYLLKLKAILKSCGLVEYEMLWCAVVVLEEVTYALKLNCDA
jgi:hypothetical protein